MENMEEKTKVCRVCGNEKPLSEFSLSARYDDGHNTMCKECNAAYQRERYSARKQTGGVDGNNPLGAYHPRELIAELRRRGYVGELKYTQVIRV